MSKNKRSPSSEAPETHSNTIPGLSDMIIEGISEAIVVVNAEGITTYVNKAALEMFGYSEGDILGREVELLIPEGLRGKHAEYRKKYMDKPYRRKMGLHLELEGFRKDGSTFPAEIGLNTVCANDRTMVVAIITDTTMRRLLEEKVKTSEERWQFALEGSNHGVWDWNVQTGDVFFSLQWKHMFGFGEDELENRYEEWEKRVHPDDIEQCLDDINLHLDGKTHFFINEHRLLCKDGTYKWVLGRGKLISHTPDGKPLRVVGTYTDITEQKKAEDILKNAALKDPLTGLSNRRDFTEKFNLEAARFKRYGHTFSLVLADIDYFKRVNDTYGHNNGDLVLKRIADIMQESLRQQDIVGRWGGEEFIILMPETSINGARTSTEKIRKKIASEPFNLNGKDVSITMSFGVCDYDTDMKLEETVRVADTRLYKAKALGRNRVIAASDK